MGKLFDVFNNVKETENGDMSYNSTTDKLLDILFMTEYYGNNIDKVEIGTSDKEKLFSMFIRDPRNGLGRRDLGRELMWKSETDVIDVINCGRYDDIFYRMDEINDLDFQTISDYIYGEILKGNELLKKWMPRYPSHNKKDGKKLPYTEKQKKNLELALRFSKVWCMSKKDYGKFIKVDTTESKLSSKKGGEINFKSVPSQAMLKYANRFRNGEDTKERYSQYLEDVRAGKTDLKVSTTTVYDIYKHAETIDPDLFFDKIEKINGNWLPIVDTSGSMNCQDAIGKALSIGHYLAKCSTYAKDYCVSFSSQPQLIKLGEDDGSNFGGFLNNINSSFNLDSQYCREIASMFTGDCSNTDFGKVMNLLKDLTDVPEYLVVLSDMEFDCGSKQSKEELQALWKERGYKTKIIWWNFNGRNTTVPETDENGNIYLSGYSPMLLKYLESGFNGKEFLDKLLKEYAEKVCFIGEL